MDKMPDDKINVRIGTSLFVIPRKNIMAYPDTTLAKSLKDGSNGPELVFERSIHSFDAIRNFYLFGKLHIPQSVCPGEFREELNFWNIPDSTIELCCALKYRTYLEDVKNIGKFCQKEARSTDTMMTSKSRRHQIWKILDNQSKSLVNRVYNTLSTTLVFCSIIVMAVNMGRHQSRENGRPESTILQNVNWTHRQPDSKNTSQEETSVDLPCPVDKRSFAELEQLSLMESICMTDCPRIEKPNGNFCGNNCSTDMWNAYVGHKTLHLICQECNLLYSHEVTTTLSYYDIQFLNDDDNQMSSISSTALMNNTGKFYEPDLLGAKSKNKLFKFITNYIRKASKDVRIKDLLDFENTFVLLYSIESISRFITCPSRVWFMFSLPNILDFISLVASWTRIGIALARPELDTKLINILMIGQMMRVFRLLRSIKHLRAFKVLTYATLKGCQDLLVIVLYVIVGIVIFGTLMFFLEPQETFPDFGQAVWWSIITMTTVGYGDVFPKYVSGKIIACICALYGIVMLALTIPLFAQTFQTIYQFASLDDDDHDENRNNSKSNSRKEDHAV